MNEQVNRAEATASTEAQIADAASGVPTSETADGGSGSTDGSFLRFAATAILTRISSTLRSLILGVFGCLQSIELRLENWLKTDEEKDWERRFREEYRRK